VKINLWVLSILGLLIYFGNHQLRQIFHAPHSQAYYNLRLALHSLDFCILSAIVFWTSKDYLRAVFRSFMIFCFADATDKLMYSKYDLHIVGTDDNWFIGMTIIILIIELKNVYIRRSREFRSIN
jgi:hypothetical protein